MIIRLFVIHQDFICIGAKWGYRRGRGGGGEGEGKGIFNSI